MAGMAYVPLSRAHPPPRLSNQSYCTRSFVVLNVYQRTIQCFLKEHARESRPAFQGCGFTSKMYSHMYAQQTIVQRMQPDRTHLDSVNTAVTAGAHTAAAGRRPSLPAPRFALLSRLFLDAARYPARAPSPTHTSVLATKRAAAAAAACLLTCRPSG